ncbi:MAG: hypothetical protein AB1405_15875, partial [Bdellovibrionota bacterium]
MKRTGKILFALLLLAAALPAHAGPARPKAAKSAKLAEALYWYDGGKRREVWVDPSLVAEFGPKAESETQVKSVSPGADILGKPGEFVRIW